MTEPRAQQIMGYLNAKLPKRVDQFVAFARRQENYTFVMPMEIPAALQQRFIELLLERKHGFEQKNIQFLGEPGTIEVHENPFMREAPQHNADIKVSLIYQDLAVQEQDGYSDLRDNQLLVQIDVPSNLRIMVRKALVRDGWQDVTFNSNGVTLTLPLHFTPSQNLLE